MSTLTDTQWKALEDCAREYAQGYADNFGHFDMSGQWGDRPTWNETLSEMLGSFTDCNEWEVTVTPDDLTPEEADGLYCVMSDAAEEILE